MLKSIGMNEYAGNADLNKKVIRNTVLNITGPSSVELKEKTAIRLGL